MTHTKLLTIGMAALFLLAVSLATQIGHLYFMSAVLAVVPLISYMLGRYALKSLDCSREAPEFAAEGETLNISLKVKGLSRLLGPIRIEDALPRWINRTEVQEQASTAAEVDMAAGKPEHNLSADGVAFSYTAVPLKRGNHLIGPIRMRATDPLGLVEFRSSYARMSRVVVFPTPMHLRELRSVTGGEFGDYQFEGSGSKGSGIDYHGVREYQPGDELRRVYWKSTARHGRLNVIEFEHSLARDTIISIDLRDGTEIGEGQFSTLEYAVRLAAGMASDAVKSGSSVRLLCAGCEGPATLPGRGTDHLYTVMHALAGIGADRHEPLSSVLLSHIEEIPRNSAVACITSAADGRLAECAEFLRSRQVRMTVVLVYLEPEPPGRMDAHMAELAAAGASLVSIACSTDVRAARVTYQHAA